MLLRAVPRSGHGVQPFAVARTKPDFNAFPQIVLDEARGAANGTEGLLGASVSCHLASLPLWTGLGALDNSDARGTVTVRITSPSRRLPLGAQPGPQIVSECQCQAPH